MKPYDPNLRDALAEIRIILDRHQIGGVVALGSKTHFECVHILPNWFAITIGEAAARIGMPTQSDKDLADASVGFICGMRASLARYTAKFMDLADAIDKAAEDHWAKNVCNDGKGQDKPS